MKTVMLSIIALTMLCGCAHVFTEKSEQLVDKSVVFNQLKHDPGQFTDRYVKLGGIIIETRNTKKGTQIEILQFPLDSNDMPMEEKESGGRFLAVSDKYLDKVIYKSGGGVALIGKVTGSKKMLLDEIDYSYPVVSIKEIHMHRKYKEYPDYYGYPYYPGWGYYGYFGPRLRYR